MSRLGEIRRGRGLDKVFGSLEVPSGTGLGDAHPFAQNAKGWGTRCGYGFQDQKQIKNKVKDVGQECPTHMGYSDPPGVRTLGTRLRGGVRSGRGPWERGEEGEVAAGGEVADGRMYQASSGTM